MILDTPDRLSVYSPLNARFAQVAEFLRTVDLETIADGRHEIDGSHIYMNVIGEAALRKPENCRLEVHDRYIDIQIIIRGTEGFGWSERTSCLSPAGEMDSEKDILFFADAPSTYIDVCGGQMIILFPWDAHAPLVGDGVVRKAIVKMEV